MGTREAAATAAAVRSACRATPPPSRPGYSFSTSLSRIAQAHEDAARNDSPLMAYAMATKAPRKVAETRSGFDLWIEAHVSQFKAEDRGLNNSGHFGIVYAGADYLLTSSILVGALVQYDWAGERSKTFGSEVSGQGVMAGPYVSVRLTPNLFLDARAAWGLSDNKVDPFGLYEDTFATNRWLASANLTGNWRFGNIRLTPSAGVTYVEEKQHSYVDALGVFIPSQTVSLGRFAVGPEIAYRFVTGSGATIEPHVSLKGIWDFDKPDVATVGGLILAGDDLSARLQAGLLARAPSGWSFRGVVSYDGVGSSQFNSIGGQVWLNVPL
jgi:outer membrane autotransporter protein